ncbi:MAG: hypothetical protein K2I96_21760 [Lachnospiraceae bacterium]|nr:hypothetical protein [Lachnospiraceae bacterium]
MRIAKIQALLWPAYDYTESMTQMVRESVRMLETLPESEQELASQRIKRLVPA